MLDMGVKWDFVQIQLNYLDWKHASGRNVNADYLYGELEKRGIPAVIMEPLWEATSDIPDHIVAHLKRAGLRNSVASRGFSFRRLSGWGLDGVKRHDVYGAFAR